MGERNPVDLVDASFATRGTRVTSASGRSTASRVDAEDTPATWRDHILGWAGEVTVTLSVVVALFVFWDISWTNVQSGRESDKANESLSAMWSQVDTSPGAGFTPAINPNEVETGTPFAKLYVPAFGHTEPHTMVAGITQQALMAGPGHYTGSQTPGQRGNFAVAGHRDGRGAPFHEMDNLNTCDEIIVETASSWYTYVVLPTEGAGGQDYLAQAAQCLPATTTATLSREMYAGLSGKYVTTPGDVDVVAPVPNQAHISPEEAGLSVLTMTTCHPFWSNAERMIVHAVLATTDSKTAKGDSWVPEALMGEV